MPIIRITKEQLKKAAKAREAALKEDPKFRAFEEERERIEKEAAKEQEKDRES
jgi:hypothetical protein